MDKKDILGTISKLTSLYSELNHLQENDGKEIGIWLLKLQIAVRQCQVSFTIHRHR